MLKVAYWLKTSKQLVAEKALECDECTIKLLLRLFLLTTPETLKATRYDNNNTRLARPQRLAIDGH